MLQYLQGLAWYRYVAFPSERVKPLCVLKAFRDQCMIQAIALCIAFEVNHSEIAHVMTYLVRGICQSFGQPVRNLFVTFIVDQGHASMRYCIRKLFQPRRGEA